jgi:hypothetical protein
VLERVEEVGKLADYYGNLLSNRHREIIEMYYFQDLSLGEISELLGMSRQGVHDLLKRAENHLYNFEKKLELINKNRAASEKLAELKEKMTEDPEKYADVLPILLEIIESM